MKKVIIGFVLLWAWVAYEMHGAFSQANADDYNEAVVANVITQVVQSNDIDAAAVMEAQLERIMYNMITEFSVVLQEHLPNILDGLASEIRQKNDEEFKCALLKNSQYECN
jgi:hypothetical protein